MQKSSAPVKPTIDPSVHPRVIKYTHDYALVQFVMPDGIKSSQPLGTGLTDVMLGGINAITIPLPRDDVKCAGVHPSAPVAPTVTGALHQCNDVNKKYQEQRIREDLVSPV